MDRQWDSEGGFALPDRAMRIAAKPGVPKLICAACQAAQTDQRNRQPPVHRPDYIEYRLILRDHIRHTKDQQEQRRHQIWRSGRSEITQKWNNQQQYIKCRLHPMRPVAGAPMPAKGEEPRARRRRVQESYGSGKVEIFRGALPGATPS